MISISGRKWQEKKTNINLVEKIHQEYNFSKILSKLIVSRNFDEKEIHLIENSLKLTNIFKSNYDFIEGVKLVKTAIKNNENICIIGDYDVDGSAATSLFVKVLENLKQPFFYYIPDREKDGYGPSKKIFEKLILKKPKLVIMVDCGSSDTDSIDFLNKNKIKSLIIDHHEIFKPFPKANVIINPKKNNGYFKYNYLCATALTYFFLDILIKKIKCKVDLRKYLIYVLLATVCDIMPIRKLNRLISVVALNEFNLNQNYAFKRLYNLSKKKNKININDLGFLFGPILNAGGRLGKSNYATDLLSSNNFRLIDKISSELFDLNLKRKNLEKITIDSINLKKIKKDNKDVIIYYDDKIKEGLIGIIAARLTDIFNKPSIVITNSNNLLKGSARSVAGYNIGKIMRDLLDKKIILKGGGHNMAAGFSLDKKNFFLFKKFFRNNLFKGKNALDKNFYYEAQLSSTGINKEFYNEIKKIEPFGMDNPNPTFYIKDYKVIKTKILDKRHISCIIKSKIGITINSISFDSYNTVIGDYLLNYKNYFDVLGQINENDWNNKKTLQLIIKDLVV